MLKRLAKSIYDATPFKPVDMRALRSVWQLSRLARVTVLRIRHSHIRWPKAMCVGRSAYVAVTDGGAWQVGENLDIANLAHIFVKNGTLTTGRNTHIGIGAIITCRKAITIGDNALIAEHVTIRDQDHRFGPGLITAQAGFRTAPITIGNNVWIGAKVTVTKGVTIGDNVVIGANSVVTRDIPQNSIAAGAPAHVIRSIGAKI